MNWIAKLEKTKKELEKTINLERRKLIMEQEMVSFKADNLEQKIAEMAELEEELENFVKEKETLRKLEEEKLSKERFIKDIEERIKKIEKANDEIQKRGEEIKTKITLLENPEPFCPICRKEMRYDQKVNIKIKLTEQTSRERELYRRNSEQFGLLRNKKEKNEEELKEIERKILAKPLVFEKAATLEEKITEVKEEAHQLKDLERKQQEITGLLREKAYAPMAQKLLKEVNKEIRKSL